MWDFLTGLIWKLLQLVFAAVAILAIWVMFLYIVEFFKWLWKSIKRLWKSVGALFASVINFFHQGITFVGDVLVLDTLGHRKKMAKELEGCAEKVENSRDPESLKKLERAAQSPDSFKRSYALDALGRLGERSSETVPIQVKGLASRDPFVREAAAHALFRMGRQAAQARAALVEVLRRCRSEGTARYAVLALGQIGGLTAEELEVLKATAQAKNSYAAVEAAELFKRFEGHHPAQTGDPG